MYQRGTNPARVPPVTTPDPHGTTEGPCMVLIEGLELPIRYDRRATTLDSITSRFEDLLVADFDAEPDHLRGRAGYRYAAIPRVCPDCGARLEMSNPVGDATNGAVAATTCQQSCGWSGRAVFRLIDLVGNGTCDSPAVGSVVASETLQPAYQPY